jgi:hypothetical protein
VLIPRRSTTGFAAVPSKRMLPPFDVISCPTNSGAEKSKNTFTPASTISVPPAGMTC